MLGEKCTVGVHFSPSIEPELTGAWRGTVTDVHVHVIVPEIRREVAPGET